jgi:hypothetical protein
MYSFRPSGKWIGAACAGLLLVGLAIDTTWSEEEAGNPAQALANWLDCEQCEHGELDAVTRHGEGTMPGLTVALNQGPSAATRDGLGRALAERYEQLVEQSKKNRHVPIGGTRERFVEFYVGGLDAQHRIRAAEALAAIGGERARAALETAATQAQHDDVRAVITRLLTVMKGGN